MLRRDVIVDVEALEHYGGIDAYVRLLDHGRWIHGDRTIGPLVRAGYPYQIRHSHDYYTNTYRVHIEVDISEQEYAWFLLGGQTEATMKPEIGRNPFEKV